MFLGVFLFFFAGVRVVEEVVRKCVYLSFKPLMDCEEQISTGSKT